MAQKAHSSRTPLLKACAENDFVKIKALLEAGEDIEQTDKANNTALTLAVRENHTEVAKLLLEHSANVNHTTKRHSTPLIQALHNNNVEIVRLLLERGANVNCTTKHRETPLTQTVKRGKVEMSKLLLQHGADVNHMNDLQETPLTLAIGFCTDLEMIKLLLEHGASVSHLDKDQTPLVLAAQYCGPEIVQLLLDHGADVNSTDESQRTPVMFATTDGNQATLRVLIQAGARLDLQSHWGKTALMMSVLLRDARCFHLLKNGGADPSVTNMAGNTVLAHCLSNSHWHDVPAVADLVFPKVASLGKEYHLLILYRSELATECHDKVKVLPSLETFHPAPGLNLLPSRFLFLSGGRGVTPFACALMTNNQSLARFFLHNWFLHTQDLSLGCSEWHNYLTLEPDCCQFLEDVFGQPWSLKCLSFVHVSTQLGFEPSRDDRVAGLDIPALLKRGLRFETPTWRTDSSN